MAPHPSILLLVLANLLIPAAILIFATGFFPYKPFIPGKASFKSGDLQDPPFDKVIFMVVDALRSDFVYAAGSGFSFTQELIRHGFAVPFTAHATSPTITMPRVKAMTTGTVPSFLDVILNFAESDTTSNLALQDTWLAQLKDKPGGKLTMYGDDTWMKLFPSTFSRADGTSSFFVSDFTEVDNNVTRHLSEELGANDWNGMFMHYLGLDHIGHKLGPKSPYMFSKQKEMDNIVKEIYTAFKTNRDLHSALLVLCGDHGMNDAGNHGGSAESETSPALVFISPKMETISNGFESPLELPDGGFQYYQTVEQSDIAPTLAALLGFPVPLNNLGLLIPKMLGFWGEKARMRLVKQNADQILAVVKETFHEYTFDRRSNRRCTGLESDGALLDCLWSNAITAEEAGNQTGGAKMLPALLDFSKKAQDILSSTASNYNVWRLYGGITLAAVALTGTLPSAGRALAEERITGGWLILVTAAYSSMMFASSFVEEEHHFWYWALSGWLSWLIVRRRSSGLAGKSLVQTAALLGCLRCIRSWNQTGQKHAGEPDIAKAFLPAHNMVLWIAVSGTYLNVAFDLADHTLPQVARAIAKVVSVVLCSGALSFKAAFTKADAPELMNGFQMLLAVLTEKLSLVFQARAVFTGIILTALFSITGRTSQSEDGYEVRQGLIHGTHDLLTLFLMTESRVTNIPIFLWFQLQLNTLRSFSLSEYELALTSILMQYSSFFAFGGSNAISSIDLSNAYNGISDYNVAAVGLLTFCSNWAGPLWWTSATALLSGQNYKRRWDIWTQYLSLLTFFVASSALFVMLACTALRTHLFIWTVFSPKYLFSMAWTLGQHLCVNILFASLML